MARFQSSPVPTSFLRTLRNQASEPGVERSSGWYRLS
jgi:hypothetical protein